MSCKCTPTRRRNTKRCEKNATEEKTSGFRVEKQVSEKKAVNKKACYEVRRKEKNGASVERKTKNGNLNKETEQVKPSKPVVPPSAVPKENPQATPKATVIPEV